MNFNATHNIDKQRKTPYNSTYPLLVPIHREVAVSPRCGIKSSFPTKAGQTVLRRTVKR
jgi:hypothetical protein